MTFLIISTAIGAYLVGRLHEKYKQNNELKVNKRHILTKLSEPELRDELRRRNRGLLLLDINTGKEEPL